MGDVAQSIVDALNNPPFQKKLSLIAFDALQPLDLLQLSNDILAELDPQHDVAIRDEDPEETLRRILSFLQVLKYPVNMSLREFGNLLIAGDKDTLYSVLSWILPNVDALKKRAYLARFLVRVNVPPDVLQNDEVAATHEKYNLLLTTFTETHKQVESLRNSGFSAEVIKKDIRLMEQELDTLTKRTERMREKAKGFPKYEEMMSAARQLRTEQNREEELQHQYQEQRNQLDRAMEKHQRALEQLREIRENSVSAHGGAEVLMDRVVQENKMVKYICNEKLPEAIESGEKRLQELKKVIQLPSMFQDDLDALHHQIAKLTKEINHLIEKKMVGNHTGPGDDKLALFRQQATIVARKKEATSDRLKEAQDELASVEQELQGKKSKDDGPKVLKADEFKRFVAKLRSKSTDYKTKKADLNNLRAEYVILSKTENTLQTDHDRLSEQVGELEEKAGITGYQQTQEELEKISAEKSQTDEQKGATLDEYSQMVKELTSAIAAKKSSLAPLITKLRETRAEAQTLEAQHDDKKSTYDRVVKSLEGSKSSLEQEVRVLREELAAHESRSHYLKNMLDIMKVQERRVKEEVALYVSAPTQDGGKRKKPMRDIYNKKIQEQDNLGKHLRDKQKLVRDSHEGNMKQLDLWRDLTALMKAKTTPATSVSPTAGHHVEQDRLVL